MSQVGKRVYTITEVPLPSGPLYAPTFKPLPEREVVEVPVRHEPEKKEAA